MPDKPTGPKGAAGKPKKGRMLITRSNPFTTLVENTVDAYTAHGDGAVEDVRRILADLRRQYDEVHNEGEKREREVVRLREGVRQAEALHCNGSDEAYKQEDTKATMQKQLDDTLATTTEALTNKKVYQHMLERLKKERSVLKQKLLTMEVHLSRKQSEYAEKLALWRTSKQASTQAESELALHEYECGQEKDQTESALGTMNSAHTAKRNVIRRRLDFEKWRKEVALEAANEAFNASAGRLKKLWAIEKLGGNCLQTIIEEQLEKSQATEDGFQKIREVTGLTDVMDIVHKFLNRDVEHEQLRAAVKEAESKLEQLREEFEQIKREAEGKPTNGQGAVSRKIYQEVEDGETNLAKSLQDFETSRERYQKSKMTLEQMKGCCGRFNKSLLPFEEDQANAQFNTDEQVRDYLLNLNTTVDKFLAHISQQRLVGKVQKKTGAQLNAKEHHERGRLLNDKDFMKSNCRIVATMERPPSAGKDRAGEDFDDPFAAVQNEREKMKGEAGNRIAEAMRKNTNKKGGKKDK